jgi:tripeptide aminopeptidase
LTADPVKLFVELAAIASPPGGERLVADRVATFVRDHGLEVREDDAAQTLGGSTGNLLVDVPPTRHGTPVFFCAHLDTVPVEGPVRPVISHGVVTSDGRTILGADNKASVAAMLVALSRLVDEGREHAGVELVFTPMEEVGCKGAKAFDSSVLRSRCGFVYDHEGPIGTYVGSAPAGHLLRLEFHGRAAHAGIDPEKGRSAIDAAGRTISRLTFGRLADGSTVNAETRAAVQLAASRTRLGLVTSAFRIEVEPVLTVEVVSES